MPVPIGASNQEICLKAIGYAIKKYIRSGETEIGLMNAWKGNQVKLVQFIREREFEGLKPDKPKTVHATIKEVKMPEIEEKEAKSAKKEADEVDVKQEVFSKEAKKVEKKAKTPVKRAKSAKKEENAPESGGLFE
jgi:hypothetical protein